ncbi:MAG: hypothetical protein SFU99_15285 [Saprospiraceae bacterium]|nr:hypothetical protein [Saprospiraceae bacterium]
MKYFLLSIFFLPICLSAQSYYALQQDMDSIYLELSATDGKLGISYQIASNNSTKKDLLNIIELKLSDADLILHYNFKSKKEKDFYHTLETLLSSESGALIQSDVMTIRVKSIENQQIIWKDAAEQLLEYGRKYALVLKTKLWGIVNCDEKRPSFTFNKSFPYVSVISLGAAFLLDSHKDYKQRDNLYDNYRSRWENGEPSTQELQNDFQDAQKKERSAKRSAYIGWSAVGIGATAAIIDFIKTKKKQRLYDEYCAKKDVTWSISPNVTPDFTSSGQLGAKLTIRF